MRKVELLPTQDCEAGYAPAVRGTPQTATFNNDMDFGLIYFLDNDRKSY